jgi:hypothetical protein
MSHYDPQTGTFIARIVQSMPKVASERMQLFIGDPALTKRTLEAAFGPQDIEFDEGITNLPFRISGQCRLVIQKLRATFRVRTVKDLASIPSRAIRQTEGCYEDTLREINDLLAKLGFERFAG